MSLQKRPDSLTTLIYDLAGIIDEEESSLKMLLSELSRRVEENTDRIREIDARLSSLYKKKKAISDEPLSVGNILPQEMLQQHYRVENISEMIENYIKTSAERANESSKIESLECEKELLNAEKDFLSLKIRHAEDLYLRFKDIVRCLKGDLESLNERAERNQVRQQAGVMVIKAQEDERRRVAREIHDGPAQTMTNLVLRAEICEKLIERSPEKIKDELHELKLSVKDSLKEIRRIIFDLRPMVLDDLGLVPALKEYLDDYIDKTGIDAEMIICGEEKRLSLILEVAVFRLVQESLQNVRKHASARSVLVKIIFSKEALTMIIIDDGKGFDLEKLNQSAISKEHFGIMGMRERVDILNGYFEIRSEPYKGTKVIAEIPVLGWE